MKASKLLIAVVLVTGEPPAANQSGLAALARADEWLNSPPLTAWALRGKVLLIDFWTYTCINWLRTLPYVRAWTEKYKDKGFVVIGVHTPEFRFERTSTTSAGRLKPAGRLSCRCRQRVRDLARLQQQLLPGAVFHRCAGTRPALSFRRGLLRTVGDGHSALCARSSSRHGPCGAGHVREISRVDRRTAARRGSRT
jgi:thiol-disulfide isomerase/thioredoxin